MVYYVWLMEPQLHVLNVRADICHRVFMVNCCVGEWIHPHTHTHTKSTSRVGKGGQTIKALTQFFFSISLPLPRSIYYFVLFFRNIQLAKMLGFYVMTCSVGNWNATRKIDILRIHVYLFVSVWAYVCVCAFLSTFHPNFYVNSFEFFVVFAVGVFALLLLVSKSSYLSCHICFLGKMCLSVGAAHFISTKTGLYFCLHFHQVFHLSSMCVSVCVCSICTFWWYVHLCAHNLSNP